MRKIKKYFGIVIALVMSMSISMAALAAGPSDSKEVPGYGTLSGSVTAVFDGTNFKIIAPVTITTNPDNAYLKVKIVLENSGGEELYSDFQKSDKGATYLPGVFYVVHFDDVHAIYAAANVQGGGTYPAQVVYTVTVDIPH